MKTKTILIATMVFATCLSLAPTNAFAQGPQGKSFGFGLQLGGPDALTFRIWTSKLNSWDAAIGSSGFGRPHLQAGYLWHFPTAFNSRIVSLYAGVGGVLGFFDYGHDGFLFKRKGDWYYKEDTDMILAARGAFGLQIIPRNTPLDIFVELDPLIGLVPGFGFDIQGSIGIRFYP